MLVICVNCRDQKVSTDALICPHCGHPDPSGQIRARDRTKKMLGFIMLIALGFYVIVLR